MGWLQSSVLCGMPFLRQIWMCKCNGGMDADLLITTEWTVGLINAASV